MKRTKNMYINPSHEAEDLYLYAVNDGRLYTRIQSVVDNLKRHFKRGNYDPERAIDAFYYVANDAAKMYAREFCSIGARPFTVTERFTAAAEMVTRYDEDIRGLFD